MRKENAIDSLIYIVSKLPGLGPRSARKIVLHLLEDRNHRMDLLARSLKETAEKVVECKTCFNIDSQSPCSICSNENRDKKKIAIVENIGDLWALERSDCFNGLFHVLGSNLNAASNKNPETLRLNSLVSRINNHQIEEVIIATNSTLDGQTTAYYITEFLRDFDLKITRLASGIPVGGELDYLDEGTLSAAFTLRQPF